MLRSLYDTFVKNKQLRNKLWFTAAIFLVYRLFAHVPVPGVDLAALQSLFAGNQFLNFLNVVAGGTLSNFSVMAVGISPYITAAIILQLGAFLIPQLKELQKEGEQGKQQITQYTRLLSLPIAVFQSMSVIALLNSQQLLAVSSPLITIAMIMSIVAGAMIVMWLGELISEYGIGNGISMILLAGILSQLPTALAQSAALGQQDILTLVAFGSVSLLVIGLIVFMNEAIRQVTIEYAKRSRGSRVYGRQLTHLPIRVNVAGVMPIIFGVSIMLLPTFLAGIFTASSNPTLITWGQNLTLWFQQTSYAYMATYFVVVFAFSFFSAMIFFNTEDISGELKKSGAFIPGIRPGKPTKQFLDYVITRITLVGAIFLGLVAVLPSIAQRLTGVQSLAVGGTGVLIVVSVILETTKQLQSQTITQNYEKFS